MVLRTPGDSTEFLRWALNQMETFRKLKNVKNLYSKTLLLFYIYTYIYNNIKILFKKIAIAYLNLLFNLAGKKCIHILDEIKICPHLKCIPGWGKWDFIKMKEKLKLSLSEKNSNGYLQNFKKRHMDCSSKICNLEKEEKSSKDPSFQLNQSELVFSKEIDKISSHLIENLSSQNENADENGFNLSSLSLFYNKTQFQKFDNENLYYLAPNEIEEISYHTVFPSFLLIIKSY